MCTVRQLWLSRVKYRLCEAPTLFELGGVWWRVAWELPPHEIPTSKCDFWHSYEGFNVLWRIFDIVSRVKFLKIITVGFISKRSFVDVLSSCRSFLSFFCLFCNFFYFCVWNYFVFTLGEFFVNFFFPSYMCGWAGLNTVFSSKPFISSFFPLEKTVFNPAQPHLRAW